MLSITDIQTKGEENLLDSRTCGIEMTPQRLERDLDYKAGFRLITPHLRGGGGIYGNTHHTGLDFGVAVAMLA